MSPPRRARGFTLVELVTIIILLGIIAVVALPRMDSALSFRAVQFRDQAIGALRFAQKTAVSHRRLVCVAFGSNSVTLTIDHDNGDACTRPLPIPGNNRSPANVLQSTDSSAVFASTPGNINFLPDGRATGDVDSTIDGSSVYVVKETGYVGAKP